MDFKIKNFTIEKFNNDVNHSGDLDEKHINWADYRKKINEFVQENVKQQSRESIFVFGAGECNDIDLKFFADKFNTVVLSDIDASAMEEGIDRQNLSDSEKEKIKIVNADYSGLDSIEFFQNISGMVNERKAEKDISSYIQSTISKVNNFDMLASHKNKYSMVLVLPTYTQLAYTQMEALLRILYQYNIYEVDDLNKIITSMYHSMPKIIADYNNLVLSLTANNGLLIVLSDILEITDEQIKANLTNKINDIEYLKEYLSMDCSDLAQMGLDDLNNKIDILHEKYTLWPFDGSKAYIVNMLAGRKCT